MTGTTISLNDYANARKDVILFWTSFGNPSGDYFPLGYPGVDWADERGFLDLTGTVDEAGEWRWDHEDPATDDHRNTITQLHAYVDAKRWKEIIDEYESEG